MSPVIVCGFFSIVNLINVWNLVFNYCNKVCTSDIYLLTYFCEGSLFMLHDKKHVHSPLCYRSSESVGILAY